MEEKMIVGCCGFGYSGSGAVVDFLREFQTCTSFKYDFEFEIPYIPHGIEDLEYGITQPFRSFSSDLAIKEFLALINKLDSPRSYYHKLGGTKFRRLTMEFIDSLVQIKWHGYSRNDLILAGPFRKFWRCQLFSRLVYFVEEVLGKKQIFPPVNDIAYLSVSSEGWFLDRAKQYIHALLDLFQQDTTRILILNQPFNVNRPHHTMRYFDNPRAILVDRDPRDIYILAKKYLKSKGNFIPSGNVDDYILYHRLIRTTCEKEDGSDILRISFEDMVYDYDETALKIRRFLGLSDSRQEKKKYFDPVISIENTQLFLKHPELAEDIHKIEDALPEYLYPFENYTQKPNHKVDAF